MLSIDVHVKTVKNFPVAEHMRKFVRRMLNVRWNRFLVCSVCDKIVSSYARRAHAIIFKNQMKMQILTKNNRNFVKLSGSPSWRTKVKILREKKKFLLAHKKNLVPESQRKCSKIEAKIEGKESKIFSKIYQGHIMFWFRSKKFQIILCLSTFNTKRNKQIFPNRQKKIIFKIINDPSQSKTFVYKTLILKHK